jgi:hypothetical protein
MYKKVINSLTNNVSTTHILKKEPLVLIPFDNNNRDYQEYLEWLEEGNVPEEPDTNNGGGE